MKQRRSILLITALLAVMAAIGSSLLLATPRPQTIDQRVHSIASQLKCPVCQDESVADSSVSIAEQMRQVIRQQVQAGKSDQQIIQFFEDRYGAGIVWSPPWLGLTLFAWLVPIALFLAGCVLLFFVLREWRMSAPGSGGGAVQNTGEILEDAELESYRGQLEQELAAEDVLFKPYRTEVS